MLGTTNLTSIIGPAGGVNTNANNSSIAVHHIGTNVYNSNNFVKIGLVLLVLFIILSVAYWAIPWSSTSKFTAYVGMIGFLGTTLAIIGFFYSQSIQRVQGLQNLAAQRASLAAQNFVAIEQWFANHPVLWPFYRRLYKRNPVLAALPSSEDHGTTTTTVRSPETITLEVQTCSLLFQAIENVNQAVEFYELSWSNSDFSGYLAWFRSWFQDSFVQEQWKISKNFYVPETNAFIQKYLMPST